MTVDVDVVVLATADEALRLVADLATTLFDPLFPGVEEVVARSFILPLRHRKTGIRVDLAIGMSGFEQEAVDRARMRPSCGWSRDRCLDRGVSRRFRPGPRACRATRPGATRRH